MALEGRIKPRLVRRSTVTGAIPNACAVSVRVRANLGGLLFFMPPTTAVAFLVFSLHPPLIFSSLYRRFLICHRNAPFILTVNKFSFLNFLHTPVFSAHQLDDRSENDSGRTDHAK